MRGNESDMLPATLDVHLGDFVDHLRLEDNRSEHTIRAYRTDIRSLLQHLADRNPDACTADLELEVLRSWLAGMVVAGAARTAPARRTSSARVFTAWLVRTRRLDADPATRLVSPRPHR